MSKELTLLMKAASREPFETKLLTLNAMYFYLLLNLEMCNKLYVIYYKIFTSKPCMCLNLIFIHVEYAKHFR